MWEDFSFAYILNKLNIKASVKNSLFRMIFRFFLLVNTISVISHLRFINTQAHSAYRKSIPIEK